jgi:hypothetical protein
MGVFVMTDHEKIIEQYKSLDPTCFDILDRFEVYQPCRSEDEQHVVSLQIWLRMLENENDDLQRLQLSFSGVRNLKVDFQGFMHFPRIHIRSIHHYQWEKLNYEVEDVENRTFSFVCATFEASLEKVVLKEDKES